mmetsp:Transcript_52221/g.91142  ORF Transcript_52221/g.91142 Transcript_52221/m.91142 type:complete len:95 (-) Transcript_52221:34-318(-)
MDRVVASAVIYIMVYTCPKIHTETEGQGASLEDARSKFVEEDVPQGLCGVVLDVELGVAVGCLRPWSAYFLCDFSDAGRLCDLWSSAWFPQTVA